MSHARTKEDLLRLIREMPDSTPAGVIGDIGEAIAWMASPDRLYCQTATFSDGSVRLQLPTHRPPLTRYYLVFETKPYRGRAQGEPAASVTVGGDALAGLRDKLFWRPTRGSGLRCCFKRVEGGGLVSLCGRHHRERSGGQAINRPVPQLRCGICDGREMERRGWSESGPATIL